MARALVSAVRRIGNKLRQFRLKVTGSPDVWYPVLLVVAGILFFADPFFSSKNFYFRDILNFHYPLRKVLIDSYARGEFPLWNPYVYLGQPMLANPNYMAFYPTNLFHLFMPFNYAFKLHFIVHPLLGGLGIYFLQRRLGIVPLAALGGSVVYQFSGTVLSFLNLYNIVPVVALMPWLGWAFVRALEGDRWRRSLLFGGVLALQIIACEPLLLQCDLLLLAGLGLLHLLESEERAKAIGRILRVTVVGGVFGLALAAVQVIPTVELIPHSGRGAGYDFGIVSGWAMRPMDLFNIIVPNLFGDPFSIDRGTYWGESYHHGREGYLVSFFIGSVAGALSILSFLGRRRKLQLVFAGLTFLSITLSLGEFSTLYRWIYEYLPVFRLGRIPSKFFLLGTLTLAVLTSLGLEVVSRSGERVFPARWRNVSVVVLALILIAMLIGIWFYWESRPLHLEEFLRSKVERTLVETKDFSQIRSQLMLSIRTSGILLVLAAALILISTARGRAASMTAWFVVILAAELIPANLRLLPLISEQDFDFVPEVNLYLSQKGPKEPHRVVPWPSMSSLKDLKIMAPNRSAAWLTLFYRRSGQPMYGIMNGVQLSLYYSVDHLNTWESEQLFVAYSRLPEVEGVTLLQKLNSPFVLTMAEIRDPRSVHVTSFDTHSNYNLHLYWIEDTSPRAYFVSGAEKASSPIEALQRFLHPDFPFRNTVILQDSQIAPRRGETGAGSARTVDYHNGRVLCEVQARTPGYLVLLDSYYPGWRAWTDGREARILRANYALRAVEVPAGKHRVEFIYRPRSFYLGLWISGVTLVLAAGSFMWPLLVRVSARIISRGVIEAC